MNISLGHQLGIWWRGEADAFAAGHFTRCIMRQARDELAAVRAMIERWRGRPGFKEGYRNGCHPQMDRNS